MKQMKVFLGISMAVCVGVGLAGSAATSQVRNPNRAFQLSSLKVSKLVAAGHSLTVWVMDTENKREEGMMFLTDHEVKSNQGMIFLFSSVQAGDRDHGFWMHNTLIPLDIIYISAAKKVLNIAEGKVQNDTSLPATGAYLYVVELKQGTAKKLGIKPGTKFEIPTSLKSAD